MNNIEFHIEDTDIPDLAPEFLRLWINEISKINHKSIGDITYIFCSDNYILKVNNEYLGHNYFTDIITFNYNENTLLNGDIFISVDTVKSNAVEFSDGDFMKELDRVIIHGILHLIGFNDKSDSEQAEMTIKEDEALEIKKRFT